MELCELRKKYQGKYFLYKNGIIDYLMHLKKVKGINYYYNHCDSDWIIDAVATSSSLFDFRPTLIRNLNWIIRPEEFENGDFKRISKGLFLRKKKEYGL